jgi:hypothetical protein
LTNLCFAVTIEMKPRGYIREPVGCWLGLFVSEKEPHVEAIEGNVDQKSDDEGDEEAGDGIVAFQQPVGEDAGDGGHKTPEKKELKHHSSSCVSKFRIE